MTRACAYCGNQFEPKSPKAKYCSQLHRNYAFRQQNPGYRKKRNLAGMEQSPVNVQQDAQQTIPVDKIHRISQQLDPASQIVFDFLREQNAELRAELKTRTKEHADEIKALNAKIETLSKEKSEMERFSDDLQRAVEAKPTGLAGLVSSQPDLAKEAIPILSGLVEKLLKPSEPVPPFVQWLKMQPEKFQQDFMAMVGAIMQDTNRLESISRSLMTASSPEQQVEGTSRYS